MTSESWRLNKNQKTEHCGYHSIRRKRGYRGLQTIDSIESLDQQLYMEIRLGGSMQVGDLVKAKAHGGIGIVLQVVIRGEVYRHPTLIQIKWFDDAHYVDINDPRSYWYHPSNLEKLCKSET